MEKVKIITGTMAIEAEGDGAMGQAMEYLKEIGKPFVYAAKMQQNGCGCCENAARVHKPQTFIEDLVDAAVGDYITMELTDGRTARFDIVDRGEDWIRFDSHDCLGKTVWNEKGGNAGGVWASDAQKYLNEKMLPLLPDYIQELVIDTERRFTEGGEEDADEMTFRSKLFLPDASELFEPDDDWYAPLYKQLDFYKDRRNRMKATEPGGEEMALWWTASATSGHSTTVVHVGAYGTSYDGYASDAICVPVCFRISIKAKRQ